MIERSSSEDHQYYHSQPHPWQYSGLYARRFDVEVFVPSIRNHVILLQ